MGFPISEFNKDGLMITCLSICTEFSQYGLAKKLVQTLEAEAKSKKFTSVEVLTFPDDHNWQPYTLYEKIGYQEIIRYKELAILKKNI